MSAVWENTQPLALLDSVDERIEGLPVSASWKETLHLVHKAGGPRLPALGDLTFAQRRKAMFNVPAFLFGPFHYLFKGMWRKGLMLFLACVAGLLVASMLLDIAGLPQWKDALKYATGAVFAVRANIDYYKKMVLDENGWW